MIASALLKIKSREVSAVPDDSEIDHRFSADFERKMADVISSLGAEKKDKRRFKSTLAKAAVIILTVCIGAFSLAMAVPSARASFKNAVLEFYETYIKFHFVSSPETSADFLDYENVHAEYIPDGYTLKEKYDEYEAVGYKYENSEKGLTFDIYVSLNEGLSILTDRDKNKLREIELLGKKAYLISGENDEKPYSTLIIPGSRVTVTIYGQLTKDEAVAVGRSTVES